MLLSTCTSAIFVNGIRGKWYKHFTGIHQGDPLSHMLFILAMDPLQHPLELATAGVSGILPGYPSKEG
jgi:hypothetical protein